jgi:hypothetical protein
MMSDVLSAPCEGRQVAGIFFLNVQYIRLCVFELGTSANLLVMLVGETRWAVKLSVAFDSVQTWGI